MNMSEGVSGYTIFRTSKIKNSGLPVKLLDFVKKNNAIVFLTK